MRALRVLHEQAEALRVRVEGEVALIAGADGSTDALVAAARHAHAVIDEEGRRALARSRLPPPACSAGCSFCCHVHVGYGSKSTSVMRARLLVESGVLKPPTAC